MSELVIGCTQDKNFIEQNFTKVKIYVLYHQNCSVTRLFVEKHFSRRSKNKYRKREGKYRVCFHKYQIVKLRFIHFSMFKRLQKHKLQ